MIVLRESIDGITEDQLHGFFVGWPNPLDPATHLRLLAGSDIAVIAVDEETSNVVGFITAITDGVLAAFISFLEVLPEYQARGIGQQLVTRVIELLDTSYSIDLTCGPQVQPFYEKLGFRRSQGMFIRNYQNQSEAHE